MSAAPARPEVPVGLGVVEACDAVVWYLTAMNTADAMGKDLDAAALHDFAERFGIGAAVFATEFLAWRAFAEAEALREYAERKFGKPEPGLRRVK